MADAFLSYARKDLAFVERLAAALEGRSRDVWVDLKDIIPTARWMEEISGGILRADAFVFVVSPDSVASEVCRTELDLATRMSKRLVPVLARATSPDSLPPALAEVNWLSFLDDAGFEAGVDRLVEVLDTDIDRVRRHTALLTRSGEWEARDRDRSLLLRGGELKDAEAWLANQAGRRPMSTPAQAQLILASRRAATRRQRGFGLSGTLVAALLALLSVVALVQWQRTVSAQHLAIARGLVAQAEAARDRSPRDALQLGLAANRIDPGAPTSASLTQTLMSSSYRATLAGHGGEVSAVVFSPDGRTALTTSSDYETPALLWDVRDRDRPRRLGRLASDIYTTFTSAAFSPDGRVVVTGGLASGAAHLWDVANPADPLLLGSPPLGGSTLAPVTAVAYSPDGTTVAVGTLDGDVSVWDVAEPDWPYQLGQPLIGHGDQVSSLAFSPDGHILATADASGTVLLWDVTQRGESRQLGRPLVDPAGDLTAVAFSPTGHVLVIGGGSGTDEWDLTDPAHPTQVGQPFPDQDHVLAVAFSGDGRYLATGDGAGTVDVWDLTAADGAHPVAQHITGHTQSVASVAFSPDGRTLATGSGITAQLWDVVDRDQPQPLDRSSNGDGFMQTSAFSPDGQTMATVSDTSDTSVVLWDMSDPARSRIDPPLEGHAAAITSVAFSVDGRLLASADHDGTVRLWDLTQRRHARGIEAPFVDSGIEISGETFVAFAPDGRTLATGGDRAVTLWDITDRDHVRPIGAPLERPTRSVAALAFSPDGRTLATASADSTAILWDLTDRARPRQLGPPLTGHTSGLSDVVFSADGRTLATASWDRSARLWDLTDREQPQPLGRALTGHDVFLRTVAFAPDGRTLATASGDLSVLLWDLTDRDRPRRIGRPLTGQALMVNSLSFAPDGHTLATASLDGSVVRWSLRAFEDLRADPVRAACLRAGATLDEEAWSFYAPGVDYQDPCAGL